MSEKEIEWNVHVHSRSEKDILCEGSTFSHVFRTWCHGDPLLVLATRQQTVTLPPNLPRLWQMFSIKEFLWKEQWNTNIPWSEFYHTGFHFSNGSCIFFPHLLQKFKQPEFFVYLFAFLFFPSSGSCFSASKTDFHEEDKLWCQSCFCCQSYFKLVGFYLKIDHTGRTVIALILGSVITSYN